MSPPSHPHGTSATLKRDAVGLRVEDRPAAMLLVSAALLGVLLATAGLYLWRRPPPSPEATVDRPPGSGVSEGVVPAPAPRLDSAVTPLGPVVVSSVRLLGCHDRGPTKTSVSSCDHLPAVEQALLRAVAQTASCMPPSSSTATVEYVAEVSFVRGQKVRVRARRAGLSARARAALAVCTAAVRDAIRRSVPEPVEHEHSRYRIAVAASYPAQSGGQAADLHFAGVERK